MVLPVDAINLYPVRTTRRTGSVSSHIVVELIDSDGNVGWGELSDLDIYRTHLPSIDTLQEAFNHLVLGRDPLLVNDLHRSLRGQMPFYWRDSNSYPPFNIAGQLAAAAEMACLDLAGKQLGVPVHVLFGGKVRDGIPIVYPIFGRTSYADPQETNDLITDLMQEGITKYRYYVSNLAEDLPLISELVARPGFELAALDFGAKFRAKDVVAFLHCLEVSVPLVESIALPLDYFGMAWARTQLSSDVSEHVSSTTQAMQIIEARAVEVFNVSVVSGGLLLARALVQIAEAAGLKVIVGTTQELGIGTSAGLHLASTLSELVHPCDPAGPILYTKDVLSVPLSCQDGVFAVPTSPGLGVEIDRAQLSRLKGELVEWDYAAHGVNYDPR